MNTSAFDLPVKNVISHMQEPVPAAGLRHLELDDLLPLVLVELDGDRFLALVALHALADALQELPALLLGKLLGQLFELVLLRYSYVHLNECTTRSFPIPTLITTRSPSATLLMPQNPRRNSSPSSGHCRPSEWRSAARSPSGKTDTVLPDQPAKTASALDEQQVLAAGDPAAREAPPVRTARRRRGGGRSSPAPPAMVTRLHPRSWRRRSPISVSVSSLSRGNTSTRSAGKPSAGRGPTANPCLRRRGQARRPRQRSCPAPSRRRRRTRHPGRSPTAERAAVLSPR